MILVCLALSDTISKALGANHWINARPTDLSRLSQGFHKVASLPPNSARKALRDYLSEPMIEIEYRRVVRKPNLANEDVKPLAKSRELDYFTLSEIRSARSIDITVLAKLKFPKECEKLESTTWSDFKLFAPWTSDKHLLRPNAPFIGLYPSNAGINFYMAAEKLHSASHKSKP